jgi:4-aminobutyrate aminotransferase-like enzyme
VILPQARRILLSTDGPYENVIKIKPPMVYGRKASPSYVIDEELADDGCQIMVLILLSFEYFYSHVM